MFRVEVLVAGSGRICRATGRAGWLERGRQSDLRNEGKNDPSEKKSRSRVRDSH
jgi:hypothetical protein